MTGVAQANITSHAREPRKAQASSLRASTVKLERIPYPYNAILAICSDLDETRSPAVYFETMKFLNTRQDTALGRGVGLEIGNTLYFDMPEGQFSYWNCTESERASLRDLIRSGYVDCFHSFGDRATTRSHALRAFEELEKHECRLSVWVDHATAPTNFGADIMQGLGDVESSPCYHADATLKHGVKFVWRGRVTSVIGQDCPRSLHGLYDARHAIDSIGCITKELVKGNAGVWGNTKYSMHRENRVIRPSTLRDGQAIFEFMRFDPFWGGVGRAATADGLAAILTESMLNTLIEKRGVGVFYTHLGRTSNASGLMNREACDAFRMLSNQVEAEQLLVLTTARLLTYLVTRDFLSWSTRDTSNATVITIHHIDDPVTGKRMPTMSDLGGITFAVNSPRPVIVESSNGESIRSRSESVDSQMLVTIPFVPLEFPDIAKKLTEARV